MPEMSYTPRRQDNTGDIESPNDPTPHINNDSSPLKQLYGATCTGHYDNNEPFSNTPYCLQRPILNGELKTASVRNGTANGNSTKLVRYDPDELTRVAHCMKLSHSIFSSSALWVNMAYVLLTALGVGGIAVALIPRPEMINTEQLSAIASFFKVFIAFMLGLHVTASYNRFQCLLAEITNLFGAVKQTQAELSTMNVPMDQRRLVERYGLLSCRLFHLELFELFEDVEQRRAFWQQKFDFFETNGYCLAVERKQLEKNLVHSHCDCSSLCWLWIASVLTRLSQDGELPAMASPTYNTLITVSKRDALSAIRRGKQAVGIQMPYPYAHMLATLVHMNNYILAIICGLQIGVSIGNLMTALHTMDYSKMGTLSTNIGVQLIMVLLIPFFYQTFLQISSLMCSPVNHKEFPLPLESLIRRLELELEAQDEIICQPPLWSLPSWKVDPRRQSALQKVPKE